MHCCSGHNWEMTSRDQERSMYFTYDYEYDYDMEFTSEFTKQLKLIADEGKYESLSVKDIEKQEYNYIDLEGWPQTTNHIIGVYYNDTKYDNNWLETTNYANLLRKQVEFMGIINEAINRAAEAIYNEVLEELSGDNITISREEIMQDLIVR